MLLLNLTILHCHYFKLVPLQNLEQNIELEHIILTLELHVLPQFHICYHAYYKRPPVIRDKI